MSNNTLFGLIAPFIIPLAIVFILIYPFILDRLFTLVREKRRIPVYAVITSLALLLSIGGATLSPAPPPNLLVSYTLLALLLTISAMAVVMPYICFTQIYFTPAISGRMKTLALLIGSMFQIPFLVALLVNPDGWAGAPPPLFAEFIPGLGHILDAGVAALGLAGQTGSSLLFSIGVTLGFYLEVAVVSTVFWATFSVFSGYE
ncbi:hypothetical protein [Methanogenium cariaci]|jgi:hypothetical protein